MGSNCIQTSIHTLTVQEITKDFINKCYVLFYPEILLYQNQYLVGRPKVYTSISKYSDDSKLVSPYPKAQAFKTCHVLTGFHFS